MDISLHKMYNKPFKIWDDSWDIHRKDDSYTSQSNYTSNQEDDKPMGYNEAKYGSDEDSDVYNTNKAEDEENKEEEQQEQEDNLSSLVDKEAQQNKEEDDQDQNITTQAANQIFTESKKEIAQDSVKETGQSKKANKKNIEEAITKAVKEEKEVIILD